jgi:hypothetical protein
MTKSEHISEKFAMLSVSDLNDDDGDERLLDYDSAENSPPSPVKVRIEMEVSNPLYACRVGRRVGSG